MTKRQFTEEELATIDAIKALPWAARFHGTVENPTVKGGKIDMYLLVDDDTGEGLVSLGVPHKQGVIADWIAGCCADPWFIKQPEFADVPDMAVALNRALKPFVDADGGVDGYSVCVAALSVFEAYMTALPKRARTELVHKILIQVNRWRME